MKDLPLLEMQTDLDQEASPRKQQLCWTLKNKQCLVKGLEKILPDKGPS
jgi:hypothetical protein